VTLIGLLDLSSTFDCVDHSLLPQRLERTFGLSGTVLCWLTSYITNRSQQVAYCGQLSPAQSVRFGVPQESVLGPLLFVLYTADLSQVVASHGLVLHQYADDSQIYISTPVLRLRLTVFLAVSMMSRSGLARVDCDWTQPSRKRCRCALSTNCSSSAFKTFQSCQHPSKLSIQHVTWLGVVIGSDLTMSDHVTAVCRSAYYPTSCVSYEWLCVRCRMTPKRP